MKKATIQQQAPRTIELPPPPSHASQVEASAEKVLAAIVDQGIRPKVLQTAMDQVFSDWLQFAEQQRFRQLSTVLSYIDVDCRIERRYNEQAEEHRTEFVVQSYKSTGIGDTLDKALVDFIAELLKKA